MNDCHRLEAGEEEGMTANGCFFPLETDENVLKLYSDHG